MQTIAAALKNSLRTIGNEPTPGKTCIVYFRNCQPDFFECKNNLKAVFQGVYASLEPLNLHSLRYGSSAPLS